MFFECEGEPKIIGIEKEYEFTNDDGSFETSDSYIYNCHECDNKECEYWKEYNLGEV